MILRNIFQILIQDNGNLPDELPPVIEANSEQVKKLLPAAKYHLLCTDEIHAFIKDAFGQEVLQAFDTLTPYAFKADLARLCYIYELGGVYLDLSIFLSALPDFNENNLIGIFRDNYSGLPWGTQNGLIFAEPKRPEFKLAIEFIVKNVADKWYGANPLDPTGPNCVGRAFAQVNRTEEYWVGDFARYRLPNEDPRFGYFGPYGRHIAERRKGAAGDLKSLGLAKSNNYIELWGKELIYGELEAVVDSIVPEAPPEPVPSKWISRLPWRIEKEVAKFLCSVGLPHDGSVAWNHALRRQEEP